VWPEKSFNTISLPSKMSSAFTLLTCPTVEAKNARFPAQHMLHMAVGQVDGLTLTGWQGRDLRSNSSRSPEIVRHSMRSG